MQNAKPEYRPADGNVQKIDQFVIKTDPGFGGNPTQDPVDNDINSLGQD
jgi:hypothetical protein